MKLSVETSEIFKKLGEQKGLEAIKEAGFDCIDYSFYWLDEAAAELVLGDGYLTHAQEVRKQLDSLGLVCNQAHAPLNYGYSRDGIGMENKNYREIVRSLEIAAILGAESIIVHGVNPREGESIVDANLRFYKSFEPYLERYGIRIAVENLFGQPYDPVTKKYKGNRFDRPEAMRELLGLLGSERYVCCLDVGHATITGIEPQDYIRGMDCSLLRALHIHDNDYTADFHVLPYTGGINWDEVASSLKEIGYRGDITFEIFGFLRKLDAALVPDALRFAERVGRHIIKKCM